MSESVYSKSYHVTDSILARVTVVQYWRSNLREISLNTEALTSAFLTLVLPGFVCFSFFLTGVIQFNPGNVLV